MIDAGGVVISTSELLSDSSSELEEDCMRALALACELGAFAGVDAIGAMLGMTGEGTPMGV